MSAEGIRGESRSRRVGRPQAWSLVLALVLGLACSPAPVLPSAYEGSPLSEREEYLELIRGQQATSVECETGEPVEFLHLDICQQLHRGHERVKYYLVSLDDGSMLGLDILVQTLSDGDPQPIAREAFSVFGERALPLAGRAGWRTLLGGDLDQTRRYEHEDFVLEINEGTRPARGISLQIKMPQAGDMPLPGWLP